MKQLSQKKLEALKTLHQKPRDSVWRKRIGDSQKRIGNKPPSRKIGTKMSFEFRKKLSEIKKGKNNNLWKGGITDLNKKIRSSLEYRLWRESVFKRDNFTCTWCFSKGGWNKDKRQNTILNADHIKSFSEYPELRFAIDNGRTLCVDCHRKTSNFGFKNLIKNKK